MSKDVRYRFVIDMASLTAGSKGTARWSCICVLDPSREGPEADGRLGESTLFERREILGGGLQGI